jgi:hypothetical protein
MIPNHLIQFPTIDELKSMYENYKPTITNFSQKATLIRNLSWTGPFTHRSKKDTLINYGVTISLDKIKQKEQKEGGQITRYWGIIDQLYSSDSSTDRELAKLYWFYIIDYTNKLS